MTPSTITASFSRVGDVMNRVSMSTRAPARVDVAGPAAPAAWHLQLGEQPGDLRLLLDGQRPGRAGDADEVGADAADVGPDVQHAAGAASRPRVAARPRPPSRGTRRRRRRRWPGRTTRIWLASVPAGGMVENTRPPELGSVATARHGIVTSSARGAPDTSGAVTSETIPSVPAPLRPQDRGGGLLHRQQRNQSAQHDARQPGDHRDQPRDRDALGPKLGAVGSSRKTLIARARGADRMRRS